MMLWVAFYACVTAVRPSLVGVLSKARSTSSCTSFMPTRGQSEQKPHLPHRPRKFKADPPLDSLRRCFPTYHTISASIATLHTLTMKSVLLLVSLLSSSLAFAPTFNRNRSQRLSSGDDPTKLELLSSVSTVKTFLSGTADDPQTQFLKQLEKKEEQLSKKLEAAKQELSKYEASLETLQTKKAEYLAATPEEPPAFTETTVRSAVKAFVWRIIAGSVTFVTTLQFSGSVKQALQVVGADFFSKSFTMFLGERLMNKSQKGRKGGGDAASRSLAKALIWRLFAICNTLTMAIFVAKDLSIASKIASTDAVFKTALMYIYERAWARINWGKEYLMEFAI